MLLILPWAYFSAMHTVSFAGWTIVTEIPLNGNSRGNFVPLGWSLTGRRRGQRALLDVGRLATWGHLLWSLWTLSLLPNALLLGGPAPYRIN